ncbi:MAG: ATP synthase F1 subunit delta [Ruminococcaceae bacterium]|nr:ATP synthase F1 subunit delta [Oscillospiraceae bacterium]
MNPIEYGNALFLLAKEEGTCERIKNEAGCVNSLLNSHPKYLTLLDTPAVPNAEKHQLVDTAFLGMHPHLLNFIKILISKRSVYLFPRAYAAYCDAYDEENNILHASAVTAVPLSKEQSDMLTAKLCKITGKNVILNNKIDRSLVGGVRLQFDGKQLDSSIDAQLAALRRSLKQSNL